ncbi:hypothetical protein ACFXGA_25845 [Actinosynnema sp. NPDC059335]|uniref:hypothetical protein n=1 Tax=Actinosynnema sp. NPDC059335 TaxID=3346804 RepID=UPI00366FCA07
MDTPRLLKLSFGIRDPPGLCANIHANRIEAAVAAFVGAVQSLAGTVFLSCGTTGSSPATAGSTNGRLAPP